MSLTTDYIATLHHAFTRHYTSGTDVWTADMEMRCFPALIQGALKLDNQAHVLDIGCGSGHDVAWFAAVYERAVGLDLFAHPNWAAIMETYSNAAFINVAFDHFETDERFDVILDNGCFHHQLPNVYAPFLERVKGLLNEKGFFALSTFKSDSIAGFYDGNGRLHKYFKDAELRGILSNAGFEILTETDIYRKKWDNYYRFTLCKALP